jgi:hypothetical protein
MVTNTILHVTILYPNNSIPDRAVEPYYRGRKWVFDISPVVVGHTRVALGHGGEGADDDYEWA